MPMYFDASTVFRAGMGPTTGIPRYERQIVRAAMKESREDIRLCCFDRRRNVFRVLSPGELAVLEEIMNLETLAAVERQDAWRRFLWTRGIIARNEIGRSREFERSAAFILAGSDQRSGIGYVLSKLLLRVTRGFGIPRRRSKRTAGGHDLLSDGDARLFLSNQTLPLAAKRLDQGDISARLYTVMYDTVALDAPHFTTTSVREQFLPAFQRAASVSSAIICISKHTGSRVSHWCGQFGAKNVPVRSVQSSSDLIEQVRSDTPIPDLVGTRFILYCSTIEPRKNHLLPLSIWKSRIDSGSTDLPTMVFCGKKGWSYAEIFNFVRRNPGIRPFVLFLHGISDSELVWLYRNALFSIFPSFEEGWGLGASESLDFGTPVVISRAPALQEATQGLMPAIDAADMPAWSSKIDELANSQPALDALRNRISESYRRTPVAETFRQVVDCMTE